MDLWERAFRNGLFLEWDLISALFTLRHRGNSSLEGLLLLHLPGIPIFFESYFSQLPPVGVLV